MSPQKRAAAGALTLVALASQTVPLVASGGCPGPSATCQVAADVEAGAALGLMQFSSSHRSSYQGGSGGAGNLSAKEARDLRRLLASKGWGSEAEAPPEIDCTLHQTLCEAPFNCQSNPPTVQELQTWRTERMATEDGHANLRSWCDPGTFDFEDGIAKLCLKNHDLKSNAQVTYDLQVGNGIGEVDGSYCFLEGFCTNTDVTYNTTLEEAETLCDAKYGHENWTSISFATVANIASLHPEMMDFANGFPTRDLSATFGMLACAQGNFHCDVIYCQDTYCKNPYYVERYGHFLKEYGWA